MAISRLGRTVVAVSGIAALAAIVIRFGILDRDAGPRPPARDAAGRAAPGPQPAPPPPGEAAPPGAEPDGGRLARLPEPSGPPSPGRSARPGEPPPAPPAAAPTEQAGPPAPSFDIVRVEPSGDSVIAGRAAPGATVELLRNGEAHARVLADPSGLFAFVPPPFPPGSHEIVLQATAPDGTRTVSRESITVAIAEKKDTKPLVALATPDRPTVVLSTPEAPPAAQARAGAAPDPAKAAPPPAPPPAPPAEAPAAPSAQPPAAAPPQPSPAAAPPPPGPRPQVRIASVEAEEGGRLFVSGEAAPGATVRLYLNETMIAPGGAGADGRVAFAIGRGVRPGSYRVRLDDVDPVSGEVKSRAEVEFRMPAPLAAEPPAEAAAAPPAPGRTASAPPAAPPPAPGRTASAPPAGPPPSAERPSPAAPSLRGPAEPAPADPSARAPSAPAAGAPAGPAAAPGARSAAAEPPAGPAAPPGSPAARALDPAIVIVPEVNTAIVSRGDSLWRISRRVYGRGVRYTVIYDANEEQIRNRHLIYPGQVFVLPPEAEAGARR